jgi:pimeloyl-ACP methyl ester carboxylesterase
VRRALACCLVAAALVSCGDDDDDDGAARGTTTTTTGTTTTTAAPTSTTLAADDPLGGFVPAPVEWEGCGGGDQCGVLEVPLDWADPTGPTIELALLRHPAGDPERRVGILTTNPGGPGASGIEFAAGGGPFAGTALGERFDVVGWDPRGVGGSAPLACDGDVDEAFLRLDSDPDDPAEQAALDAAAAEFAAGCGEAFGELLPHVGTDQVAFDLEAIRRSLGQPMAYVGFSYGTFIGLRYAELFPSGARSIVLDGVVDPTDSLTDLLRAQVAAFDDVVAEALGDRADEWDRLAAEVEVEPVPTDDGRGLGPADLATGTGLAGYDEEYWEYLREGVDDALDGDGSLLLAMADAYRDLGSYAAYQAVSCVDSENPRGSEAWAAFAAELEGVSPRLGAGFANEMLPCAFWPVPSRPVIGPVRAEGSPPILVIGTTGDPATPVAQAEAVAAGLADGHLLVYDGEGHVAIGRDDCVDDVVEAYLLDGVLPADGARC